MNENDWKNIPLTELINYQAHPMGYIRNKKTKEIRSIKQPKQRYISYSFSKFTIALHKIINIKFIKNNN